MKKLLGILLALVLLLSCGAVFAETDDEWADFHCTEEQCTTKIPAHKNNEYKTDLGYMGFRVYLDVPGYPPYVLIHRRPLKEKFNNPMNYLNNIYREFLEEKYTGSKVGMNPAKTMDIGGKQLIGARYYIGDTVQLQLIEVRDLGDVEYTAMFDPADEERTMKALNMAVEYYREDDAQTAGKSSPSGGRVVKPLDTAGQEVDVQNGTFWTRLTDLEGIDTGGYFTAELYQEDLYPAAEVESIQPGDKVVIEGETYTVKSFGRFMDREDEWEVVPEEAFSGYLGFLKTDGAYYHALLGNRAACHFATDISVTLPLPNDFAFAWVDGEDVQIRDANDFIRLLREKILEEKDLTPDSTAIQFKDGLVMAIAHSE